jgi:hypothetical protein
LLHKTLFFCEKTGIGLCLNFVYIQNGNLVARALYATSVLLFLFSANPGRTQEMLAITPPAMAGGAATALENYNIQWGPTRWSFGSSLEAQYTDNVFLTQDNPESDLIVSPQMTAQMLWPISEKNTVEFSLGAGYSAYLQHSELDRFFITPSSALSFDLFVGPIQINFHERFSISQDAYQDPTVSGTGDYSQFQNDAGVTATWNLEKLSFSLGYDHLNNATVTGPSGAGDGQSDVFSASAGYRLVPEMTLGLEAGGSLIGNTGTNTALSDVKQWNVGSFCKAQISENIHLLGRIGYTEYSSEATGTVPTHSQFSGVYGQLTLTHQLNQYLDYSIDCERSVNSSFYSGSFDSLNVNLRANWHIVRKLSIITSLSYEHDSQVLSGSETFDRYGAGIKLTRTITSKLSGTLGYQFYQRNSNLPGENYTVNTFNLNLAYKF